MSVLAANPLWFVTRATGTVSLILLTATLVVGIASAGRYAPPALRRFEIAALHRNLSILTLSFLAIHVVTALADTFVPLGWWSAVIPFVSPYRTFWLGLGTVSCDLLIAVALTSALRLRLGLRRWKAVHWLAYGAWPVALFHAGGTGTDTRLGAQLLLGALCVAAVVAACWWRLATAGPGHAVLRVWLAVGAGAVPALLCAFLAWGPLVPGWPGRWAI